MRAIGVGIGLAVGAGLVYGVYTSEAVRLVTVGVAAFVLAVVTIIATALVVNRQWLRVMEAAGRLGAGAGRYPVSLPPVGGGWNASRTVVPPPEWGGELLPPVTVSSPPAGEDEEVVA